MSSEEYRIPSKPSKVAEGISFFKEEEVSFDRGRQQVMCLDYKKSAVALFPSKKKAGEYILKKHPGRYKPSYVESALSRALNNPKLLVFNHYWRYVKE
jgi:hypothetical protein